MDDIAERMVEYRAKHNLTQRDLAERVGVTVMTINSIENGRQTPSKVTRAKIELAIEKEDTDATVDQQDKTL